MRQRKVLSIFVVLVLVLSVVGAQAYAAQRGQYPTKDSPTAGSGTPDTPLPGEIAPVQEMSQVISSWAEIDVKWMIENDFVPENLQGDYKDFITREEYASLIYRVLSYFAAKHKGEGYVLNIPRYTKFKDVDTPMVNTVYAVGIVNGISAEEFKPRNNITREEGAAMMANLLNTFSVRGLSTKDIGFKDKATISKWAIDAVNICSNAKIFAGTGNGFSPRGKYTREQAILTVRRLLDVNIGHTDTVKIRNKLKIPVKSIGGGITVGDKGLKFIEPGNSDDQTFLSFVEGLSGSLSAGTIKRIKNASKQETLKDGNYTVTFRPYMGHNHSVPDHKEVYSLEISW
ncbi:S-layer homology domain-containing protein [Cohnella boryungensis]|uniref:S-layer homology domain-containing protein n=1 Tax=Cohnella boryungensis TaxID=768479 RepID=A0ABV8S5L5_9BACL